MKPIFRSGHKELSLLVAEPSREHLMSYFNGRLEEWSESFISCEGFSVGVFYDLGNAFANGGAYDLLGLIADTSVHGFSERRFCRWLDLLLELAEASKTTQMPASLEHHWNELASRAVHLDPDEFAWTYLKKHYRR